MSSVDNSAQSALLLLSVQKPETGYPINPVPKIDTGGERRLRNPDINQGEKAKTSRE